VKRFTNAARTQDVNLYGCGRLADAALVALLAASQARPAPPLRKHRKQTVTCVNACMSKNMCECMHVEEQNAFVGDPVG
jgi:hypothetical protein